MIMTISFPGKYSALVVLSIVLWIIVSCVIKTVIQFEIYLISSK